MGGCIALLRLVGAVTAISWALGIAAAEAASRLNEISHIVVLYLENLPSGADTLVQVDGDLDTAIDMAIRVVGVHITAADLIL